MESNKPEFPGEISRKFRDEQGKEWLVKWNSTSIKLSGRTYQARIFFQSQWKVVKDSTAGKAENYDTFIPLEKAKILRDMDESELQRYLRQAKRGKK